MIFILKGADFSASNIGQLDFYTVKISAPADSTILATWTEDSGDKTSNATSFSVKKGVTNLAITITMSEGKYDSSKLTQTMNNGTLNGSIDTSTHVYSVSGVSITGNISITIGAAAGSDGEEEEPSDPTPDGSISVTWEVGAIDSGNGPNSSATMSNRARTQGYIQVNSSITISASGNAEFCPIYYKANKTYISSPNAYQTDALTVDGSTYPLVRIMIRDKSNTNATMSAAFGENYITITGDGIEIPYGASTDGDTNTDINGIHDGETWVVGAVDSSTGKAVNNMTTRIRTGYIPLGSATVSVSNTAEFCPILYNSDKSFKSTTGVYQTEAQTFTSTDGAYLVLMARNKDATTTTLTADYGVNISIVTT